MSDAAEKPDAPEPEAEADGAEKKPKKEKPSHKPGCLISMAPVTTPGCAGCLTAVFLITTVATVWITFYLDGTNVPWRHSMSAMRIAVVLALTVIIPIVVYKMIQWWIEGEAARFPDLDYAWQAGLQALSANGISLAGAPLYLVLGSSGEQQEKSLLQAAGLKLRVEGVPEGPAPLHWYANTDGIYLFCSDACWTSAIASLREELLAEARGKGIPIPDHSTLAPSITPEVGVAATPTPAPPGAYPSITPPAPAAPPMSPVARSAAVGGTMMLDDAMLAALAAQASGKTISAAPAQLPPSDISMPPGMMAPVPAPAAQVAAPEPTESITYSASYERNDLETPVGMDPVVVAPQYSAACLQQLQYLCNLLRRARQPVCPLNGVLMLLQLEAIHSTPAEMDELLQALRADLSTLQYAAQLRCPVTALIVGLEKERGFRELVRRVGKDRAATQRFGRKFDVRALPTKEELGALSLHVCGAFEDWAYALFREENALTRPGNTRLYELLAKVRCGWKMRLAELLSGGFGCESTTAGRQDSLLFSGCYLAATGETPDRQAFAKGVVDKLKEEQELVEWNRDAAVSNRRQTTLANVGMLATLFLASSLVVMFVLARLK